MNTPQPIDVYLDGPAMHPDAALAPEASARWARTGHVALGSALVDGLAAELVPLLRRLPFDARAAHGEARAGLYWACDIQVPPVPDPQIAEAMFRLVRFADHDLPALVSAMVGVPLIPAVPGRVSVWSLRKGSYYEAAAAPSAPPGAVQYVLSLTPSWPTAWGGQLSIGDASPIPLGADTLHLIDPSRALAITMLERHTEALLLHGALVPQPRDR